MCGVFGVYVSTEGVTRGGTVRALALCLRQERNLHGLLVYIYMHMLAMSMQVGVKQSMSC